MADIETISIEPNETSIFRRYVAQIGFWSILVVAVGLSRVWFGGAFVIDFVALVIAVLWLHMALGRNTGTRASLTKAQIGQWVAEGCPSDVRTWKAVRYG